MIKKGSPSDQFEELQNKFLNQEDSDQKQSDITLFAELIGKKLIYSDPDIGQYLFSMLKSLTGEGTQWLEEFLTCFFDNGLSRYIDDYKESSLRCFDKELVRFYNLIWLIRERLRGIDSSQLYYKVAKVDAKFCFFLRGKNVNHVDLSKMDLEGAHLEGVHLSGANLTGTNLEGAHLEGAHLTGVHLTGTHLPGVHLEEVHLKGAHLEGAHLEGVNLEGAHLEGAHLTGAHLVNAKLKGAHLEEAHLEEVHLTGANLTKAVLKHTIVDKEKLREVILDEKNYMKFFGDESK